MNIISYTTTTSDYPYTLYLKTTLKSLRKYNSFKVVVFVLDNGIDKVREQLKDFDNLEFIDFSDCKTKDFDISKIPLSAKDIFGFNNISILVGPECIDYMYKNYDYDVLFRFDTDVIFTDKVNFDNFYNSNKAFGGCKELYWHEWTKNTFGYSCLDKDVYNVGLSMFRKSKQIPDMYERMLKFFESVNYKINTFEQDAVNSMYNECYDLNEEFCLAVNRIDNKVSAIHFNSPDLKPLSFTLKQEYKYLSKYYQEWNKIAYPDLYNARKCFYSSVDGDKYIDLFIVTVTSYKKHNALPIDWIVICKDENQLFYVKSKTQFLSDSIVNVVYATMPEVPVKIDYPKYNSFKWTSEYANKIFCDRVYFVDVWKDKYDLMCCVDLDVIFIDTISDILDNFLHSNVAIGGTFEPLSIKMGFEVNLKKIMPKQPYDSSKYVNFGFGMLNTKYLRNDNFEHFAEISKGYEDFFNTQEQAYFAIAYQNSIKNYPNVQALIWGRVKDNKYKHPYKYKCIHFTPSKYLFENIFELELNDWNIWTYATTIIFYKKYAEIALESNISEEFKNTIIRNMSRKFDKFFVHKLKTQLGF